MSPQSARVVPRSGAPQRIAREAAPARRAGERRAEQHDAADARVGVVAERGERDHAAEAVRDDVHARRIDRGDRARDEAGVAREVVHRRVVADRARVEAVPAQRRAR